jgi:glutamate dehydrogenase (NADP+)
MPTCPEGVITFCRRRPALFAPGKASNAGGVATSGLEMSQNSLRLSWTREEVDARCTRHHEVNIHDNACRGRQGIRHAGNYVMGANIAGFTKVADAMVDQGLV